MAIETLYVFGDAHVILEFRWLVKSSINVANFIGVPIFFVFFEIKNDIINCLERIVSSLV